MSAVATSERDLLRSYGSAVNTGNAALFVGAGLSLSAGYPTWNQLLEKPRLEANIPDDFSDLPLLAQYYVQDTPGGRENLESHMLNEFSKVPLSITSGHQNLALLPVEDVWTTNYDCLIESAMPSVSVVTAERDLEERRQLQRRRVMKMHGSLTSDAPPKWREKPVITRRDYEEYEAKHPRLWAALRATYLTRSLLFLGFSFTDPNIEVLLRLSRTLLHVGAPEHFTVLRRPTEAASLRLHELQVKDLEKSGVAVCEITDYNQLQTILQRLVRRTRGRTLFVSGSTSGDSNISECTKLLGNDLASLEMGVSSLAGPAAMRVSYTLGNARMAEQHYKPEHIQLKFRRSNDPAPPLDQRIGTAIYTNLDKKELRETTLADCRAAVFIGGGQTTLDEAELAKTLGVPVIPIASSGGAARSIWQNTDLDQSGITLEGSSREGIDWRLLDHEDIHIATRAGVRLIKQAMYLDESQG